MTFADDKNEIHVCNGYGGANELVGFEARPPCRGHYTGGRSAPLKTRGVGGEPDPPCRARAPSGAMWEGGGVCACGPPPVPGAPGALTLRVLFLALSCCSSWEIWLAEFSRSFVRLAWSLCTSSTSCAISRSLAANSTSRLERVRTSMACSCGGERR